MLNRNQMVAVIEAGGSVLHKGRLITRVEQLPSAASLASTPEEKAVATEDLDAKIAELQAQKALISDEADRKAAEEAEAEAKAKAEKDEADKADKAKKDADAKAKVDADAKAKAEAEAKAKADAR